MESHLTENNQTYFEHFKDSMFYSGQALKASFYFCIHAVVPESFKCAGSTTIFELSDIIDKKLQK